MTDHTPGPWFVHDFSGLSDGEPSPYDIAVSCTSPDHLTVAVMGLGLTGKREEWRANALLIATAPDLLEALEAMMNLPEFDGTVEVSIQRQDAKHKARAAIARARGEK